MTEPGGADGLCDAAFAKLFEVFAREADASPVLLAVSGGPDSIAMMYAAASWSRGPSGPPLRVATVDHDLRPGSRTEAEAVGAAAQAIGLPHAVLTWTNRQGRAASQEAARHARYGLLLAHARETGAHRIATAHTRDDQAETVLMRLAEGSGLTGLAAMAAESRHGGIVHLRPFLSLAKADLVATCRARGWRFVEDPSNSDVRFARTRWRALMPALAAEGLDARRLARFAGRMRRADLALAAAAEAATRQLVARREGGEIGIDFAALAREPDEIALRVLMTAIRSIPGEDPDGHLRLDRVEAALAALQAARMAGVPLRRTLAGRLSLDRDGRLAVAAEPTRSRGRA